MLAAAIAALVLLAPSSAPAMLAAPARIDIDAKKCVLGEVELQVEPASGSCLFLQRDPSGYADSVNLYAGFGHDPVNKRDPTGLLIPTNAGGAISKFGRACMLEPEACGEALIELVRLEHEDLALLGTGIVIDGPVPAGDVGAVSTVLLRRLEKAKKVFRRAKRIGETALKIAGRTNVSIVRAVSSSGVPFDQSKLSRIRKALRKRGVSMSIGKSNVAALRKAEAGAYYDLSKKKIVFGPEPTRTQVIEELIHAGQHRKAGSPRAITPLQSHTWDLEAKEKILKLKSLDLTPDEIEDLKIERKFHELNVKSLAMGGRELSQDQVADVLEILGWTPDDP